jgi:hypothetical protein
VKSVHSKGSAVGTLALAITCWDELLTTSTNPKGNDSLNCTGLKSML